MPVAAHGVRVTVAIVVASFPTTNVVINRVTMPRIITACYPVAGIIADAFILAGIVSAPFCLAGIIVCVCSLPSADPLAAERSCVGARLGFRSFVASPWSGWAMPAERLTLASQPRPPKSMKEYVFLITR